MNMLSRNLLSILLPAGLGFFIAFLFNLYSDAAFFYNTHYILFPAAGLFFIMNLVYAAGVGSESFTGLLLGGLVAKFLLALFAIVIWSALQPGGLLAFSAHLLLYYILFTVFEIRYLLHLIKTNAHKHEK